MKKITTRNIYQVCRFLLNCWILLLLTIMGCAVNKGQTPARYITWDGLEPDKWASIWLIKRHIDPDAEVLIRPVGSPVDDGIPFGVPTANFRRTHGVSVYESLVQGFQVEDPALKMLGEIINDIEITPWDGNTIEQSALVEQAFREMQESFDQRNVPIDCYSQFFDATYQLLSGAIDQKNWTSSVSEAKDGRACQRATSDLAFRDNSKMVRRIPTTEVLGLIDAGKKVMFVDAREEPEFNEYHIPGAINLKLREVNQAVKAQFEGADLVIGYCIKDFRGFEIARALGEIGVENVAIMKPYGIAGWKSMGLPIAEVDGMSDEEALKKLEGCARGGGQCL